VGGPPAWGLGPSVVNKDNLRNVSREASRHFRNKKREYLKDKINEIEPFEDEACLNVI
jgi:hypothetical protein